MRHHAIRMGCVLPALALLLPQTTLVRERFLPADDAGRLVREAEASNILR